MKKKKNGLIGAAVCAAIGILLAGCASDAAPGGTVLNNENGAAASVISTEDVKETAAVKITAEAVAEYPLEPEFKDDDQRWEYSREKRQKLTEEFAEAYGDFAVKTSAEILKNSSENVTYSPLSLYYALAMACNGAEGETQEEMLELLGYESAEALAEDCKNSFEALYHAPNEKNNQPGEWGEYHSESRYSLLIANSLWADDTMTLKDAFKVQAAENFYADVFREDLQSEAVAKEKSQWVNERTNGLITPSEEPADQQAVLSIINTIYFYDEWIGRFAKEKTEEDIFTLADGTEVSCDFMNQVEFSSRFRRGDNYTASSLSLKNSQMTFVLPDAGVDVHELVNDPEQLEAAIGDGGESLFGKITWKVPKFSYGSDLELAEILSALGMNDAFTGEADFSGISDQKPLFISNIRQNAHLGIDEEGVEGAAYTEIMYAGAALPKDEAEMILDRPFLYAIKNNGQIVFIGICENPTLE